MVVYVKKADMEDLDKIMEIIEDGKETLYSQNIPQWVGNDGPNRESFKTHIKKQEAYILRNQKEIIGISTILTSVDQAYESMKDGKWEGTQSVYASIHRVALSKSYQGQGLAGLFLSLLISTVRLMNYTDIRIDTHPQNFAMQKLIQRAGFIYKGTIMLPVQNGKRKAYQLILS